MVGQLTTRRDIVGCAIALSPEEGICSVKVVAAHGTISTPSTAYAVLLKQLVQLLHLLLNRIAHDVPSFISREWLFPFILRDRGSARQVATIATDEDEND